MDDKDNIYLIGIGGIGMSALARYFKSRNKNVGGYDRVRTPLCEQLEKDGMDIHYEDTPDFIPETFKKKANTAVIYTPAIPDTNLEYNFFLKKKFEIHKRAKVLGMLAGDHTCLAVAGTHGKTTTSALLAHLFKHAGHEITAFLGGISVNYQSNFLAGDIEKSDLLIAEADEYDRSFLQLNPSGAIITSMDADHLDIYEDGEELQNTFIDFSKNISKHSVIQQHLPISGITYGLQGNADYRAENVRIEDHNYLFDIKTPDGNILNVKSGLPGRHNIENAIGAAALAHLNGLELNVIKSGIESFKGVKRRFEYHIKTDKLVFIDDYAHHPKEIDALLNSVRELYPNKKITGIFQPHLYSRTRDFASAFAASLEKLDELILMEIYPARERPIPGISSAMLLDKTELSDKKMLSRQEILSLLREEKKEVVLTIGAGDIDQLINPIKMVLLNG